MALTVWLPTAAVLVIPHENRWVDYTLNTADIKTTAAKAHSRIREDGWFLFVPITLGLLAGLYLTAGSLTLRPQRLQA